MAKEKKKPELISRPQKIAAGMILFLAAYIYRLPPMISPVVNQLSPLPATPPFTRDLSGMLHLYRKLEGAESLLLKGDIMYTGLLDGQVVQLDLTQGKFAQVEMMTFTGDPQRALPFPCGKFETQPICGRPLGIDMTLDGKLVVADAYKGLLSIDLKKRDTDSNYYKAKLLSKKPDDDRLNKFRFLNDVAVAQKSGDIFFTESTNRRQLRLGMFEHFEGRAFGRLFRYDAKTKKAKTVMKNLAYPTGVVVDPNEKFVLVAERSKNRIAKISLKSKKPKLEVFAKNLPIWPERITWDVDGEHLWVAGHPRHGSFNMMQWLNDYPALRSLLAKCVKPFTLEYFLPSGALVLRLDAKGKISEVYGDSSGKHGVISGVYPKGDDLFFSMYTNSDVKYVGKMTRAQLGLESHE